MAEKFFIRGNKLQDVQSELNMATNSIYVNKNLSCIKVCFRPSLQPLYTIERTEKIERRYWANSLQMCKQ